MMNDQRKPWLKHYPEGVPAEIKLDATTTLTSIYRQSCQQYAKKPAFTCQGETLTYEHLWKDSCIMAAYFQQELGLKKGDRLAIMLPNLLQYPVTMFAALQAGLTIVNLNPLDKARSLQHELVVSGARAVVVSENFVTELQKVIKETAVEHIVISSIGALYSPLKRFIVNCVVRYIKKMVPKWQAAPAVRFRKAFQIGERHLAKLEPVEISPDDIAFLQFTSGTTGQAKGVMLSHGNMVANTYQCHTWVKSVLTHEHEAVITALPLYHVFSLMANCFVFVYSGGENVLIPNPRDIPTFIKTLRKTYFTGITGVNTLYHALMQHPQFDKIDFSHCSLALGGGMAVQPSVAEEWVERTQCILCQGYGLSEASPVVTISPVHHPFNQSIGFPVPSTDISIRNAHGQEVALGEPGELWVKGPQVMQGYWQDTAATKKVLTDEGWLHTGDVATMDEMGFVYLVDRLKDMINVSGFSVSSIEVEAVISKMPEVSEVAVIGVPDPNHGEVVKACVILHPRKKCSVEHIIQFCHDNLAAYKAPKHIEFHTELPKNHLGKILKKALR